MVIEEFTGGNDSVYWSLNNFKPSATYCEDNEHPCVYYIWIPSKSESENAVDHEAEAKQLALQD